MFQFTSIASCCHWVLQKRACLFHICTLFSGIYIHWWDTPPPTCPSRFFSLDSAVPGLRFSTWEKCSSPLIIFLGFWWTISSMSISHLYWESQNQTLVLQTWSHQCWAEMKCHLSLPAALLLLQPSILLAFFAARAHCSFMFNFVSTRTLRCFSGKLLSTQHVLVHEVFFPWCRILHFPLLNCVEIDNLIKVITVSVLGTWE